MKRILIPFFLLAIFFECSIARVYTIEIDGETGEIKGAQTIFYAGDIVTFKICRANLLKFSYEMKVDKEVLLVKNYNIIGDNTTQTAPVVVSNPSQFVDEINSFKSFSLDNGEQNKDGLSDIVNLANEISDGFTTLQEKIIENLNKYDKLYNEEGGKKAVNQNNSWNGDYLREANLIDKDFEANVSEIFKLKLLIIDFNNKFALAKLDGAVAKDAALSFTEISVAIENNLTVVLRLRAIISRWNFIEKTNPVPEIQQKLLIGDAAKQYFISILWKLVNEPPVTSALRQPSPSTGTTPPAVVESAPVKKISIMIEGHVKSHFNFNFGIAGFYLPDNQSFSYGMNFSERQSYQIVKNTSTFKTKFYLSLGWYFMGGVDDFDPNACGVNPMLMIGCDIATSPSYFMLGLGADFRDGFNLNFGITQYNATYLNAGWENANVSEYVKTQTVNPPTHTEGEIGVFIAAGFRPKIFSFFSDLIKPK